MINRHYYQARSRLRPTPHGATHYRRALARVSWTLAGTIAFLAFMTWNYYDVRAMAENCKEIQHAQVQH